MARAVWPLGWFLPDSILQMEAGVRPGFSQFLLLNASVEAEVHDLASEFHGAIVRQGGAVALPEEGPDGIS